MNESDCDDDDDADDGCDKKTMCPGTSCGVSHLFGLSGIHLPAVNTQG